MGMVTIYSVIMIGPKGVKHCDMTLDEGVLKFELLGERLVGKSRRGLSKQMDLLLYKIEKSRRKEYQMKEVILEVPVEDLKCWRVEEHTGKGLAREYPNTFLFLLRMKDGKEYKILINKKVFKLFLDQFLKKLKRYGVEKCGLNGRRSRRRREPS